MNKIAIVTDSTVNLPLSYIDEYKITVGHQIVIWDNKTYQDGVDITSKEFYERLKTSATMPSSSQVSPTTMTGLFSNLLEQDFDVLGIFISAKLSGTMSSAIQAKEALPGRTIELVDSHAASMSLGFQVLQAARAAENGASLKECKAVAEKARSQTNVYFLVETLEFLHRGGRIGNAAHLIGTALDLKPVLRLKDGKIESAAKVRTQKKAYEKLLDLVGVELEHSRQTRIAVMHAAAPELAENTMQECITRFHPVETIITELTPAIGTHTGPGAIAISFLRDM